MIAEEEKHNFNLGQNIDVRDTAKKWVNGQIVFIKGDELYIHYSGWTSKFDEYINYRADRILVQWQHGKEPSINNRVDAFHPLTGWLEARIIDKQSEIDENTGKTSLKRVKVHYFNYHPKYDRWIDPKDPKQMDIIGAHSKAYGVGKSRFNKKSQNMTLSEISKKLLQKKIKNMVEQLRQHNYVIKEIQGDGNCLFRSISDQLYGNQNHHSQIRQLCMDYIKNQSAFFQNYVTQDLEHYIQRKSQDGVWGDDIEIEALSQIYGRPIQIYATSSNPLRTFHEDNEQQIQPLRLAYVGYCHYNSIKKQESKQKGLIEDTFGTYQTLFLSTYQSKSYDSNINKYRDFFSRTNGLDFALSENVQALQSKQQNIAESLMQFENKEISKAIQISEAENILEQIQNAQMRQIQNKFEQQNLQEELRKIQQKQIQLARELSKKVKKDPSAERPYWFGDLLCQGFQERQILFAIEINGYDADAVQNFLLDNM